MKVLDLPGLKRFNTKINALIDKRIEKAMISHVLDSTNTSMVLGADVGPKVTQLINNVNTRVDRVNSDLANKLDSSAIITQYNKLQIGNVKIQYGKMECIVNFNGQASIVFPEGYSQENLYHCMAVPMSGSYAVRSITNSGNNNSLALLLDSSDTKPEYQSKIWMQYIVIGT